MAGWVKAILGSARIDTNLFTANSARATCTSKAKVKDLSLEDILKRGNWSNKSTWHYQKFTIIRSVRKIYGTGTIGWQNSALDRWKFHDIKFTNFVRPRSGRDKIGIL